MKRTLLLLALAAAGCAATGPYDRPWAIVTTDIARSADPNLLPVIVNRIDGENAWPQNYAVIAPGRHQVTVDVPPRKGFHLATQNTFELQAEPCTRYYIGAQLRTRATQEWQPVVRKADRIGECMSKFAMVR